MFLIDKTSNEIKNKIEDEPDMTIEELRRHILTVSGRRFVIKTEGSPPLIKYTTPFLDEFNQTNVIASDNEESQTQTLTQHETPKNDENDDDSTTLGESVNLLEAFESHTQEQKGTLTTPDNSKTSANIISPPAHSTHDSVTKPTPYRTKRITFTVDPNITQTPLDTNKDEDPTEATEQSDLIEKLTQIDTQFQTAVDDLEEFMHQEDPQLKKGSTRQHTTEQEEQTMTKKIEQEVLRQMNNDNVINRLTEQLTDRLLNSLQQRLAKALQELEERTDQMETMKCTLQETELQLEQAQARARKSTEIYETLQLRIDAANTKTNEDYNLRKYQRQQEYQTIIQGEMKQLSETLATLTTRSLAKYEQKFHTRLANEVPRVLDLHLDGLKTEYQTTRSKMISDLDSLQTLLKEQMTTDFQEAWTDFKEQQLTTQLQEEFKKINKDTTDDLNTQAERHQEKIIQHSKLMIQTIDTATDLHLKNIRTISHHERERIEETATNGKKEIQQAEQNAIQTISTRMAQGLANPPTDDPTTNLNETESNSIQDQIATGKLELADQLRTIQQTLRSEHGRLQKDLNNTKTETLEAMERHKTDTLNELDRKQDTDYSELPRNNTQASPPPLTQPSQSQQFYTDETEPTSSLHHPSQTTPPKTPIFGKAGDTLEDKMRAYDEKIAQEATERTTKARTALVMDNLYRLHSKSFDDIMYLQGNEPPNQAQIVTFYTSIANLFNSLSIPIVPYEQLTITSGTFPADEPVDPKVQQKISSLLFTKLHNSVPKTWHKIRTIIESYTTTQDGYNALFSIMTNNSGYLRLFRTPWGPTWKNEMNSYQYLTELRHHLTDQRRYNQTYTPHEIAAEILQQANQHDRYKVISTTHLSALQGLDPKGPLPTIFTEQLLIDSIEINEQKGPQFIDNPTINKFRGQQQRDHNSRDNDTRDPRKRFNYRREVQCTCCTTFGHDIDQDVCKIGAQVFAVTQFISDQKDKATKNAKAYSIANNKTKIALAKRHFPDDTSLEDLQHNLMDLAHGLTNDEPVATHDE